MSLQIWLPLNGNTDNIGLSGPINFTNYSSSSMSWPDSGKIGKALSLNGGCKKAPFNFNLGNAVSASCWVYYTARPSTNDWMFSFGTSSGTANTSLGLLTYNTYMVMCIGGLYTNWTYTLETGKWYHFCVTWDGSIATLYKDGEPVLTSTDLNNGTKTSTTYFCLGGNCSSTPTTTTRMKGMLNDVRVYDHCLSPQEVREISQALVLHYKLDGIEPNNIPFDFNGENWTQHNYSGGQTTSSLEHGVYHVNGYQQDTNKDTSFHLTTKSYITLEPDTDYWLSFDCVVSNSLYNIYFGTNSTSYYTGLINSSGTIIRPVSQVTLGQNFSGKVNLKIHTDSDTQYKIRLGFDTPNLNGVGSYIEFSNVMITKIQQNYVPYWYTNNVIYDCSGYSNNGTSTGQIQLDNNTVKYNNCTKILADNSYISFPTRKFQEFTYSFWVKRDRLDNWDFIATSWNGLYISIWQDPDNKILFRQKINNSNFDLTSTTHINDTTKWYHIACTRDSSGLSKLYVNGILEKSNTNANPISYENDNTDLGRYSNYQFLGSISDFRIYATALSENEIKELYDTSTIIDNKGTLHAFEILENSENLLKYENCLKYTNPANTSTRGKIVMRNGTPAMAFQPTDTYFGTANDRGKLLYGFFKENTQYLFDLWLDNDEAVDNSGNAYWTGFKVIYTDGTENSYETQAKGANTGYTPIGFQHKVFISPPNKSIKSLRITYNYNKLQYVRADSTITEVSNTKISKTGIVDTGQFIEGTEGSLDAQAIIYKGEMESNSITEI